MTTRSRSADEFLAAQPSQSAPVNMPLDTDDEMDDDFNVLPSRAASTRDAEEEYRFVPQAQLPEIPVEHGFVGRWVRATFMGQDDTRNISSQMGEGWEPIRASEPGMEDFARRCGFHKSNASTQDLIEVGGLIACKAPEFKIKAREAYYEKLAKGAMRAEDARMYSASPSHTPLEIVERRSVTTRSPDG